MWLFKMGNMLLSSYKETRIAIILTDASSLASDDVRFLRTFVVFEKENFEGTAAFARMNFFGIPHNSG